MMIQGTVIKRVFRTSKKAAQQERNKALAADKPCGRLREVKGGWCYNEWHSGPKVNLV